VTRALEAPGPERCAWQASWSAADGRARRAMDHLLDGWDRPFEGRIAATWSTHWERRP
jgi:hypothetical protein